LMTILFFALFTLIRVISVWKGGKRYFWISIILFIFSLPGLYLIIETGEHGAELVYKYGVGVQKIKNAEHEDEGKSRIEYQNKEPSLTEDQDGSWRWEPKLSDKTLLIDEFIWLNGEANSVGVEFVEMPSSDISLKIRTNNGSMFITRGINLKSVQADLYCNLTNFNGTVQLAHHIQDDQNYDFVTFTEKKMILGRLSAGKIKIMDEKQVEYEDWIKLSVVGDGTHFRGLINDTLYTHGHAPELPPGTAGLAINGEGSILLDKIDVKSLR